MHPFKAIKEALLGMWSLLVGMGITGKYFFQPQKTVHYPRETVDNIDTYRGHVELVPSDDDPFEPRCLACGACARICPSNCLIMERAKDDEDIPGATQAGEIMGHMVIKASKAVPPGQKKKKKPGTFFLDYTLCSLCGQCVNSCPAGALRFTDNVYLAGYTREEFHIDLLERLHEQARAMQSDRNQEVEPKQETEQEKTPEAQP